MIEHVWACNSTKGGNVASQAFYQLTMGVGTVS